MITREGYKELRDSYVEGGIPWALRAYHPESLDDTDWLDKFRLFLEDQLDPCSGSFFPIEYKALYAVCFGDIDEIPLYLSSEIPGIFDISSWRLLHS
jgi:hypothetical protein